MATQKGSAMRKERNQRQCIALTGANGFLGSRLLKYLQKDRRYSEIVILDIKPPDRLTQKCKFYQIDLTEPGIDQAIAEILTREQCDAIVHLAFHSSPRHDERLSHELTVIGTLNMLKACRRANMRKLVIQSTTLVYGASYLNPSLLDEDHPLNGAGAYSFIRDKVEVERMLQKFAKNRSETIVSVLRFCPILSRHHSDYITHFLKRSVVLTTLGYDPLIQFIHEEDALAALKKAVDADVPGAFNVVGKGVLYLSTVLKLAEKASVPVLHPLAYPLVDFLWYLKMSEAPGGHLDYLRYSCIANGEKAEKVMGFSPVYSTKDTLLAYLSKEQRAESRE
jgi:UDP-glucose 4-epimerase